MAHITFKLGTDIKGILSANDFLGFDTAAGAAEAILTHDDYADRWEIREEDQEYIKTWRWLQLSEEDSSHVIEGNNYYW